MNRSNLILTLALGCSITARAGTYDATFNSGFANSGNVPAGSLSGWSDSETITSSQIYGTLSSITVNLDVAGGYNGSLYGYLEYNGVLVTLLNRSGVGTTSGGTPFGYGNSGFNVTFDSSAANNIHFYQNYSPTITGGQLTGTWAPDGTAISPLSSPASFNTPGGQTLSSFNGLNPDGTWTLFLATSPPVAVHRRF